MVQVNSGELKKEMQTLQKLMKAMAEYEMVQDIETALQSLDAGDDQPAKGVCEKLINGGSHLTHYPTMQRLAGLT